MGPGTSSDEWLKHGTDSPDLRHYFGVASSSPARRGYTETRTVPAGPVSSKPHSQPAVPPWDDPPFNANNITIDGNLTVFDDGSGNNQYGIVTARQFVGGGFSSIIPSGDATGATDFANLQGLFNLTSPGNPIRLQPGFKVNQTVVVPSGSRIYMADAAPPASFRDAGVVAPPTITAVAAMQAVLSDSAYTAAVGITNPVPSSDIELAGLDIDCNGLAQTAIALITQGSAIANNRIRNSLSHSILVTDTSFAGNTTTGGVPGALNENYIAGNRVYNCGGNGIYVQSQGSLGTDGYLIANVVDGNFASAGTGIVVEQSSDWHIFQNHVYAMPGGGFRILRMSHTFFSENYADNFGQASVAATTYIGFDLRLSNFGGNFITSNFASTKEAAGAGAGNFTYFSVIAQSTGLQTDTVFAGNRTRQISATSGTRTPYLFNGGAGGSMNVAGVASPLWDWTVAAGPVQVAPSITNTVTFPDYRSSVTSFTQTAVTASTASTSLVMAGLAVAFTPKLTGKIRVWFSCGGGTQTAAANVGVGCRYGTGTAPVNGAAVTGTAIGSDQAVRCPTPTVDTAAGISGGGIAAGLTPGTAYWIDLAYDTSVGADVAQIGHISITVEEVA